MKERNKSTQQQQSLSNIQAQLEQLEHAGHLAFGSIDTNRTTTDGDDDVAALQLHTT
jgi:hypothetical protein